MDRQNVTIALPKALLKKAKIFAAEHDTSLSQLLKESLEEKIAELGRYEHAQQQHLALLQQGFDLGSAGNMPCPRDKLHDR